MDNSDTNNSTAAEFSPELEARIRNHEAKRRARILRLHAAADRAEQRAESAIARSSSMASCIPMGQPILVGHHSEKWDRRFRDRIWRLMGRGVEESKKAQHYRTRAEAAAGNDAIMSDDPLADRKLETKIAQAEELQRRMREANSAIRRHAKAGPAAQVAALVDLGFTESQAGKLLLPDFCGRIGFPDYALTNNSANIRRMKQRLVHVEHLQATPTTERENGAGIRLEDCPQDNRLRLYFPSKPAAEIRARLKRGGFRWAPSIGAWQAFRNWNASETAKTIMEGASA